MGMVRREDPDARAEGSADLLLGVGTEFDGKLSFAGTVRIDAKFKGSIVTKDTLIVGDRARVEADISCGTVIVYGEVTGSIKATTAVELHAPAKVRGDVETPSFSMEKGVMFQGQSTMPAEKAPVPRSVAAPPAKGEALTLPVPIP